MNELEGQLALVDEPIDSESVEAPADRNSIVDPVLLIKFTEMLKYRKGRFEKYQSRADLEKYNFAVTIEAAEANDITVNDILGLNDDQINAILDWKRDFDDAEAVKQAERQAVLDMMEARFEARKDELALRREKRAKRPKR